MRSIHFSSYIKFASNTSLSLREGMAEYKTTISTNKIIIMGPKAYSYIRFSSPIQETGDSEIRQLELSEQYAKEHGLVLDNKLILLVNDTTCNSLLEITTRFPMSYSLTVNNLLVNSSCSLFAKGSMLVS